MSNVINLIGNENQITFNLGEFNLYFNPSDKKSKEIADKAEEMKEKADNIKEDDEWEARKALKELLDEFFVVAFGEDVPEKIYGACGENTLSYLKVFMQISAAIHKEQKKQLNDETFKKYLSE